jgi:hypothetical protein
MYWINRAHYRDKLQAAVNDFADSTETVIYVN